MKTFKIENKNNHEIIKVTLYQPPYEDENILNKTGWKQKDVIITDITLLEDK
tara:strand:- start:1114 stop:1269 length:156 start_codon:yes stop_codon:yes gene_type:complete